MSCNFILGKKILNDSFILFAMFSVIADRKVCPENMRLFFNLHLIITSFFKMNDGHCNSDDNETVLLFVSLLRSRTRDRWGGLLYFLSLKESGVLFESPTFFFFFLTSLHSFWGNSQAPEIGQMPPGFVKSQCPWTLQPDSSVRIRGLSSPSRPKMPLNSPSTWKEIPCLESCAAHVLDETRPPGDSDSRL